MDDRGTWGPALELKGDLKTVWADKCFLKKRLGGALRMDLTAEGWRREDWPCGMALEDLIVTADVQESMTPLLGALDGFGLLIGLQKDIILWWDLMARQFPPLWKDSGHVSYPNATVIINFPSSIQLFLAFIMSIFKIFLCMTWYSFHKVAGLNKSTWHRVVAEQTITEEK